MSNHSMTTSQFEGMRQRMSEQVIGSVEELDEALENGELTSLGDIEQAVRDHVQELGGMLLSEMVQLAEEAEPARKMPCRCGHHARYMEQRPAQIKTLLGTVRVERAYYYCSACRSGFAPLDEQLGMCAGSISSGLDELLALVGAQGPFDEAAALIEKLTLVAVSPNRVRASTENLGSVIAEAEDEAVEEAWDVRQVAPRPPSGKPIERLYVSMDGTMVHIRGEGWKEIKLGAVYHTVTGRPRGPDEMPSLRAQDATYYAEMAAPEAFGRALWLESKRRGAEQAIEIVVIGDGARWIWKQVEHHWPNAIQIVDWYHASERLWEVAREQFGEGSPRAKRWAKARETELWEGRLRDVIRSLDELAPDCQTAAKARTYFQNNRQRMRYPDYRAAGIQIGSGTIESGCKHVIGARLKQAGMRWCRAGARFVAKVRAAIKSGRWDEVITLRPPPSRSYSRAPA